MLRLVIVEVGQPLFQIAGLVARRNVEQSCAAGTRHFCDPVSMLGKK